MVEGGMNCDRSACLSIESAIQAVCIPGTLDHKVKKYKVKSQVLPTTLVGWYLGMTRK